MQKHNWKSVKRDHVILAIKKFDRDKPKCPTPRNTFLIVGKRRYPAKHIRGMAYKIVTGQEITKGEYTGGKETYDFFTNLGCTVQYKTETIASVKKENQLKIARLVVRHSDLNKSGDLTIKKAVQLIEKFINNVREKYDILATPAAFFRFTIPDNLKQLTISEIEDNIDQVLSAAEGHINRTIRNAGISNSLSNSTRFVTFGIDGYHPILNSRVELVSLYDTKKSKTIHWTGKFYPTEDQKRKLIHFKDLASHFVNIRGKDVAILGCHDLNVYSPEGRNQ